MATLTPAQIYALAQRYFGDLGESVVQQMAATAMGESGGQTDAINNTAYPDRPGYRPPGAGALPEYSGGIWQVNTGPGGNTDLAGLDLSNPEENARAARIIYDRQGPGAWSVYSSGAYQKHLPTFSNISGTAGAGATKTGTPSNRTSQQQPEAITMTSDYGNSSEMLWGYLLPYLAEQAMGPAANRDITLQTLAGYINPNSLGFSTGSGVPTLAREMYEGERADADRNYALDVARFGVDTAMANYTQRMGAANVKLSELGLMASQRGPSNAISYNYLLNNLAAPPGQEVNPHATSDGIYQPINLDFGSLFGQPKAPKMQASSTSAGPSTSQARRHNVGTASPTAPGSAGASQYAKAKQESNNLAQQGQATFVGTEGGLWSHDPKTNEWVEVKKAGTFAQGGVPGHMDAEGNELIMLGDDEGGAATGNEELLVNPTGAPVGVVPNEAIPPDLKTAPAGKPDAEEILQLIGQLIQTADLGGIESGGIESGGTGSASAPQPAQGAAVPRAADGGVFSNTVYSPEEIAGMPVLQKIAGNMDPRSFGGTQLDMSLPGSEFSVPAGHRTRVDVLEDLHGSEVDTLQNVVEAPREHGGLGLVFGDWIQDAYRAAPLGRSLGVAGYGN